MVRGIRCLGSFLRGANSLVVLSGAGVSTASGIPDYRDRNGNWKQAQPMQYGDFMRSEDARRRYWSRSYVGWQRFSTARPNAAHYALAAMETAGYLDTLITQNVDGLHGEAGSANVVDLHGNLGKVRCMSCSTVTEWADYQVALLRANPGWRAKPKLFRADGDVELAGGSRAGFRVPCCPACGGTVKPDVVMFGESVPKHRVGIAMEALDRADALLVVGSSLMVFSGFRFAQRASKMGKPIAIVNRGRTRADDLALLKVDNDCTRVLFAAFDLAWSGH